MSTHDFDPGDAQVPMVLLTIPCPPNHRLRFGYSRLALEREQDGHYFLRRVDLDPSAAEPVLIPEREAAVYIESLRRTRLRAA